MQFKTTRATLLAGAFLTAAALSAPIANAEGGVPGPGEPYPVPVPGMQSEGSGNGCQGSEVRVDGNCIPAAGAPIVGMQANGETTANGQTTRTTEAFENPVDNVPSINGDPCAGQWESTVCYAEGNVAPVQPHSELSASP